MIEERPLLNADEAKWLLNSCGLSVNKGTDYTIGIFDEGELIATGSLSGDMIQMVAVDKRRQGEGLAAKVMTNLLNHAFEMGYKNVCLFTKPEMAETFVNLGFKVVAIAKPYSAMLEWGRPGIEEYCRGLKSVIENTSGVSAAVVMNCNPFTIGHRYLVERASAECAHVFLFIVQENLSVFPFNVRYRLAREATADFKNVTVLKGGRYVISHLTFPSYFTRKANLASAECAMDAEIFLKRIAPALNIKKRYVGTEPYSETTKIYNETLKKRLIPTGISVCEIMRLTKAHMAVSASHVRKLLAAGDIDAVKQYVPTTTFDYLKSQTALPVLKNLATHETLL